VLNNPTEMQQIRRLDEMDGVKGEFKVTGVQIPSPALERKTVTRFSLKGKMIGNIKYQSTIPVFCVLIGGCEKSAYLW
jgi:hypothetical protein